MENIWSDRLRPEPLGTQHAPLSYDLLQAILQRYDHVRQKMLLTDNRPE